ncbi:MAG: Bor/Iss family lipoprotein [Myxococcota bacterium]
MSRRRCLALAVIAGLLGGCHTIRFDLSKAPAATEPIVDRKSFWFFGASRQNIDVHEVCPYGVAAIEEEVRFTDGLFANLTIGMYTPRTSYYWCRLPPPAPVPASGATP